MKALPRTSYRYLLDLISLRKNQEKLLSKKLIPFLKGQCTSKKFAQAKYFTAVSTFEKFIGSSKILFLNEALIDDFFYWVKENRSTLHGTEVSQAAANLLHILNLIDNKTWLAAPILLGRTRERLRRFISLSEDSRQMLVFYEENARQVKTNRLPYKNDDGQIKVFREFVLLKKQLADIPKFNRIDLLMSFMKKVGLNDFKDITIDVIKESAVSQKSLKEISFLFANLHQSGFLKANPFSNFDTPASFQESATIEYIDKDGIDRMHEKAFAINKMSYRQALGLLYCLLAYDSCLRAGEMRELKKSDITIDDHGVTLRIRPEIQKGQQKAERYVLLLFDETSYALKSFQGSFNKNCSKSDYLFVDEAGRTLTPGRVRSLIAFVSEECALKIADQPDKRVTSHHFRRTFGTLNAPGIGLSLSLDELADRMRHSDPKTTRRHYIAKNSYLEKMKLEQQKAKKSKSVASSSFSGIGEFLFWLEEKIKVPKSLMDELRVHIKNYETNRSAKKVVKKYSVPLAEALVKVSHLPLKESSFIKFALDNAEALRVDRDIIVFTKEFIEQLEKEYMPQEDALAVLYVSPKTIYNNSEFFGRLRIGQKVLVKKGAVLEYKERGANG